MLALALLHAGAAAGARRNLSVSRWQAAHIFVEDRFAPRGVRILQCWRNGRETGRFIAVSQEKRRNVRVPREFGQMNSGNTLGGEDALTSAPGCQRAVPRTLSSSTRRRDEGQYRSLSRSAGQRSSAITLPARWSHHLCRAPSTAVCWHQSPCWGLRLCRTAASAVISWFAARIAATTVSESRFFHLTSAPCKWQTCRSGWGVRRLSPRRAAPRPSRPR